ncbi:MAG: hypothetical protein RXO36_05155 [Candidatus Nanopusillus acidilobi]
MVCDINDNQWRKIIYYLKEDANQLEKLGVVVNFEENSIFMIDNKI